MSRGGLLRTRAERIVLVLTVVVTLVLVPFAFAGFYLPSRALAGMIGLLTAYALVYFATRSSERREPAAQLLLVVWGVGMVALGAFIFIAPSSLRPNPHAFYWDAILGFLIGLGGAARRSARPPLTPEEEREQNWGWVWLLVLLGILAVLFLNSYLNGYRLI